MNSYLDRLPRATRIIHGVEVEVVLCPEELPSDLDLVQIMDVGTGGNGCFRMPWLNPEPEVSKDEPEEYIDARYFEPLETPGIRSLMQARIFNSDWTWPAPAARCRSCGCVTWVVKIVDGLHMLSNAKHRKGCSVPPSSLEATCAEE